MRFVGIPVLDHQRGVDKTKEREFHFDENKESQSDEDSANSFNVKFLATSNQSKEIASEMEKLRLTPPSELLKVRLVAGKLNKREGDESLVYESLGNFLQHLN